MSNSRPIHVIIVAGGCGSRFGATLPKQYCDLDGMPVLIHTVNAFRRALPDSHIIVVVSGRMKATWLELCCENKFESPEIIEGGASRSESVRNAVVSLTGGDGDIVLVHDGARPLVDEAVIKRVVDRLNTGDCDGVIPAVAVTDSLRVITGDDTSESVDRSGYRAVQTPQGFNLGKLKDAYSRELKPCFTDDASVMESAGYDKIKIVDGSSENIKITHPLDLELAGIILRKRR